MNNTEEQDNLQFKPPIPEVEIDIDFEDNHETADNLLPENTQEVFTAEEQNIFDLSKEEKLTKDKFERYGMDFYLQRFPHKLKSNKLYGKAFEKKKNKEKKKDNKEYKRLLTLIELANPPKEPELKESNFTNLFQTAVELHKEQLEPLSFIIQDFLPSAGAYLLSSKPKTGKTFLALQMSSCIASGEKFLDIFDTIQGQVLYVMTQGGRRALKHRIEKVFKNKKKLKNLFYLTAIDPLQQGGYGTIQNFIDFAETPKLIVLDMITNMFPNIKHSNYQAWAQAFETLNNFAIDNNICILCVYHSRKEATESSDFTDDVLGSTGILGSVSGVLTLRRSRDKGEGEIFINLREAESKKKTLVFSDACWSYIGDSLPTRPTDRKIYFLLKEKSGSTNKEIATALDKDRGNIARVLKRMLDDRFIYVENKRYYLR